MKHNSLLSASLFLCFSMVAATPVSAALIPTLFNTGVNASGVSLANNTIGDPHYSLVSVPGGTTGIRVRRGGLLGSFPIPPWIADSTSSAWIGPNNDSTLRSPPGTYQYRTTFDLSGFVPSTASITGRWAADNRGLRIALNGVDIGAPSSPGFTGWTALNTINTNFVAGINTLDFFVENAGTSLNPTGLRVELTGTADLIPISVPAPSVVWLLSVGVFVFFGINKTKQKLTK